MNIHYSLLTDFDIALFKAGRHYRLYEKLGAHVVSNNGVNGVYFAVWAPNALSVSVVGDMNFWNRNEHKMFERWDSSGIWELFIPGIGAGVNYKYFIQSHHGYSAEKGDPFARKWEAPPATASTIVSENFKWSDKKWMKERSKRSAFEKPLSIYEMHIGSWRRDDHNGILSYREIATQLPEYCREMGYTHVEFMPVMEHPFYGSWGYQVTGYFAPSSRYGSPSDFMFLINALHAAGIGIILDWVPSHFPTDEHGLGYFDGTHLFEHEDARKGFHPDWKSFIFNYQRNEVRSFLISNALYWLDVFHADGLRVDAVASMLYLDYSRNAGEWLPNEDGGNINYDAVHFLKEFNMAVHEHHPDTITIAEESTAWPGVTHPVASGGLGFDYKWMMGWMHDTLRYLAKDPIYRSFHHDQLTFSLVYAYAEKFLLPLSHDEVVYGKRSLLEKMPGDEWQQFANLRLLLGYMYGHPGAKMLFMGGDTAQRHEWRHDFSLDWHETNYTPHRGVQRLVKDLNTLYTCNGALHELDFAPEGFEWLDIKDTQNSVISWIRRGKKPEDQLIFIAHFTPSTIHNYRLGVPDMGNYREVFNSDNALYGGSNQINGELRESAPICRHGRAHSISFTLSPLAVSVWRYEGKTFNI